MMKKKHFTKIFLFLGLAKYWVKTNLIANTKSTFNGRKLVLKSRIAGLLIRRFRETVDLFHQFFLCYLRKD